MNLHQICKNKVIGYYSNNNQYVRITIQLYKISDNKYAPRVTDGSTFDYHISKLSYFDNHLIEVFNDLKKTKISVKSIEKYIRLNRLSRLDKNTVEIISNNKKYPNFFRNQGPVLKQNSKYKKHRRDIKRYRNPLDGENPAKREKYIDYGFDEISSNVFGHPNLRFTLNKKKTQKGYRRPAEKQKELKDAS